MKPFIAFLLFFSFASLSFAQNENRNLDELHLRHLKDIPKVEELIRLYLVAIEKEDFNFINSTTTAANGMNPPHPKGFSEYIKLVKKYIPQNHQQPSLLVSYIPSEDIMDRYSFDVEVHIIGRNKTIDLLFSVFPNTEIDNLGNEPNVRYKYYVHSISKVDRF